MHYELAPDLYEQMVKIVDDLGFAHIDVNRVACLRSRGSKARRVIARLHGLGKVMQLGMNCGAFYIIEFLERFERCTEKEKIETIIHELLHIPKTFGGGFRHHDFVNRGKVGEMYEALRGMKQEARCRKQEAGSMKHEAGSRRQDGRKTSMVDGR